MRYVEAIEAMAQGHKVKLPEWTGYWYMDGNEDIAVFTKDGDIIVDNETQTSVWHNKYKERTDWEITEGKLGFDWAIRALKNNKMVRRKGWNGQGMFAFMRPADSIPEGVVIHNVKSLPQSVKTWFASNPIDPGCAGDIHFRAYFCLKMADGTIANGWVANTIDQLSEDWELAD